MIKCYDKEKIPAPQFDENYFKYIKEDHFAMFARHIFTYLRGNPELLSEVEYRRLYEETLAIQINHAVKTCGWDPRSIDSNRKFIELLADISNDHSEIFIPCDKDVVDAYLNLRRLAWNTEV